MALVTKNVLRVAVAALSVLVCTGMNAEADLIQLQWDVSAGGAPAYGDPDTLTGVFDQIGLDSQTTTVQYDTDTSGDLSVGDLFTDSGDLRVNGLIAPGIIDTEGLNQAGGYEVTGTWTNLMGEVTAVALQPDGDTRIDVQYNSGTINLYLDPALNSLFANPVGSTPPSGAGGFGFGDGNLIATLSLVSGTGHTFIDTSGDANSNQGTVNLAFAFTYLDPGFWLNSLGVDLTTLYATNLLFALTDQNIDTPSFVPGGGDVLYTAYSNQNGSVTVGVVPEPASLLLFGSGLFGVTSVVRRRRRRTGNA